MTRMSTFEVDNVVMCSRVKCFAMSVYHKAKCTRCSHLKAGLCDSTSVHTMPARAVFAAVA